MTKLYTIKETADYLHCHPQKIKSYIQDRILSATFVAGRWLIPETSIRKFMDDNGTREFKVNG